MVYFFLLGLYALMLIATGIIGAKRSKTAKGFMLGGRKTGPWMSAFAYGTTYFSAVIFVGYAGNFGWNIGLSAVFIGIGNAAVGSYLAWRVLAKRTREMTHAYNVDTMPAFFQARFGSRAMKVAAALIIFVFLAPYSASVYQGISYLFEQVFGISFAFCALLMAGLTAGYLIIGGYVAATLSDFLQGIIMLGGTAMMVFFVLKAPQVGGLSAGIAKLSAIDPALTNIFPKGSNVMTLVTVVLLTSLGSWAMPQLVHKFYAVRDDGAIRRGRIISTGFSLFIGCCAYFSGIFGRLFVNNAIPLDPATGVANIDMVVPNMLVQALPEVLLGFIVLLMLSASMSTLSGLTMVSASAVAMDLYKGVWRKDASDRQTLALMRVLCLVFIAASVGIALFKVRAIAALMSFSWGTIAGCFLGPFVWGLHDKKTNAAGAWGGIILGLVINVGTAAVTGFNGAYAPVTGCVAMIVSLVAVPLISRLATALKRAERTAEIAA
jgi:SSS family solute:Na+ symporter